MKSGISRSRRGCPGFHPDYAVCSARGGREPVAEALRQFVEARLGRLPRAALDRARRGFHVERVHDSKTEFGREEQSPPLVELARRAGAIVPRDRTRSWNRALARHGNRVARGRERRVEADPDALRRTAAALRLPARARRALNRRRSPDEIRGTRVATERSRISSGLLGYLAEFTM